MFERDRRGDPFRVAVGWAAGGFPGALPPAKLSASFQGTLITYQNVQTPWKACGPVKRDGPAQTV